MIRLPTTDIYLRNACRMWIQPSWRIGIAQPRPIRQIAPNAFTCGEWMVLLRQDSLAVMQAALAWRGRLAYLIDDDIVGASDNADLPEHYRQRLATFAFDWYRHLLVRADVLVVPSAVLAARFVADAEINADIRRIEPCWNEPFADQDHFTALADGQPLRIAHLGTGSHRGALALLAPALADLLARHRQVQLTYIAAAPGIPVLAAQPGATRQPPRPWAAYRRWLPRQRFHLALYPLLPTTFDRARSANKLLEHAIVGAVGLYPDNWAPGRELALGEPGHPSLPLPAALLAPAAPGDWGDALEAAVTGRHDLAAIAAAASETLFRRDFRARQQQLWGNILSIDLP